MYCTVLVNPDGKWEQNEEAFKLKLASPTSELAGVEAALAYPDELILNIKDDQDKPLIKFRNGTYDADKPLSDSGQKFITVIIDRVGDNSKESLVTLYTEDALAKSGDGHDYLPKMIDLRFLKGESSKSVDIEILYNPVQSIRKSFWVNLSQDKYHFADVSNMEKAIVYINDPNPRSAIIFPVNPIVVSLLDYDSPITANMLEEPVRAGYPLREGSFRGSFFLL